MHYLLSIQRPPALPIMVTFLDLPDALHKEMAVYFPKHNEALPRIASTCHYCRAVYASQVIALDMKNINLARGSDLPESEAVTDWETSIKKHSRILGRLLGLIPSLTEITGHVCEDACIEEILGRALLIAPAPNNLTVFRLHTDVKYFRAAGSLGWSVLFRPRLLSNSLGESLVLRSF